MANSLVRSNRESINKFNPSKIAKASDFENNSKNNKTENNVSAVTFNTNLKISNHSRNKLQTIATLGYAENQRLSLDIALRSFYEGLTSEEQKQFDLQLGILEKRDIKLKSKN